MSTQVFGVVGGMLGLIFVYLLFSHGDVAVKLVNSSASFITSETTALQGR